MSRKSAYVGWFGRLNLPEVADNEEVEVRLEDLNYNSDRLSFKLVRYVMKNVPIRYTTINYVKHPVEWKLSTRSAVIFKVNKMIDVKRYCEIELKKLDIPKEFKLEILEYLNYIPSWRQKEIDLQETKKSIYNFKQQIADEWQIPNELSKIAEKFDTEISHLSNSALSLKRVPSSTLSFVMRIVFSLPTLFLSWIGFVAKTKAANNIKTYQEFSNKIVLAKKDKEKAIIQAEKEFENENLQIKKQNQKILKNIQNSEQKVLKIIASDYTKEIIEDGFLDLRKSLACIEKFDCTGVYIIWNKNENKYYVGQSKDVYKRVFTQHFKLGDVNNVIFAKDWYAGHNFYYKIFELKTKDELDKVEKECIEKYDSFKNGYNKTGGNW